MAAAALLGAVTAAWVARRAAAVGAASAVPTATPCQLAVEIEGAGVACWDGRRDLPPGIRSGDRVTADGRRSGRMLPSAIATYQVAIDPNRADADELEALPGIGPTLARRIIEERERGGRFRSVAELLRVKGIGEKTLDKLRPQLRIDPE